MRQWTVTCAQMCQRVPWFHNLYDGVEEIAVDVVEDATHHIICFFAVVFFDPMEFTDVSPAYGPFVIKSVRLEAQLSSVLGFLQ